MEFRLSFGSRKAEERMFGNYTRNSYKRLNKEHSGRRKLKIMRIKDMQLKSPPDVKACEDRVSMFSSPLAVFARLKTAYVNLLQKAGSVDDIRELFGSVNTNGERSSSTGLTKFERQYLEHLKRILEDGQSVVI
ncbi:hypothetical protein O6H91_13G022300 [Diphasiastrum complanatum]|uniref:Uncharacterized protein n=1 Tax=Diphasiastrum complanatum TaxID=34168 RepID=A0ACC2BTI7_DIPCM|nr:hypothetical protein O6H91_Y129100 [Diphasiastrum complanatum]KAJ7532839.1 hypothetical protein O6H91_13G022300 [Diphasiastrum complanatum]